MPAPPPARRPLTPAERCRDLLALLSLLNCTAVAEELLNALKPPICEALGSGATYRLAAACSWGFSDEGLAALQAALEAARACGTVAESATNIWGGLLQTVENVLDAACMALDVARHQPGNSGRQSPYAAAVLATLCKHERLLGLLDVTAGAVVVPDAAAGAVPARLRMHYALLGKRISKWLQRGWDRSALNKCGRSTHSCLHGRLLRNRPSGMSQILHGSTLLPCRQCKAARQPLVKFAFVLFQAGLHFRGAAHRQPSLPGSLVRGGCAVSRGLGRAPARCSRCGGGWPVAGPLVTLSDAVLLGNLHGRHGCNRQGAPAGAAQ